MAIKFNRSQTFATGGTVTSAALHNLIDGTDIYPALITDQSNLSTISTADKLLIADTDDTINAKSTTVQNLFDQAFSGGTYTALNLSGALTYGTATGNRTVSTSASITTGTINNATLGTTTGTNATITNLTSGTTTSTATNITNGTIQTLTSSTATITGGTFSGSINSTTGTINNFSTTLAGDLTISQGTATLGTSGVTASSYGTTSDIPRITVDAKGRITSATTVTAPVGFRNRIINGDMRIDQRNAGSVVTVNTGSPAYTLDRWFAYQNSPSTGVQVSRSTSAPSGFQNSIKWGRNGSGTAGGVTVLGQALETSNCFDMQDGKVTLSFYAKSGANFSGASSQIGVTLYSGTGTDESVGNMVTNAWTGSSTPISSTATLTTSWQRFTYTATLGSSVSQLGVYLSWTTVGTAGADDNVYITGVQLEAGSTATDFERRPYGTELALCQRYYWQMSSTADTKFFFQGYMYFTTQLEGIVPFPVQMRSQPTITSSTPSRFGLRISGNALTNLFAYATTGEAPFTSMLLYTGNSAVSVVGYAQSVISNSANPTFIGFNAEL